MSDPQEQGPVTRTITRAMAILHAFDEARPELGVTELGQRTGLDKSTVYRLLRAWQQGGLIEQNPETAKYHLGFGLLPLAGLARRRLELPRIARPHLEELAGLARETVTLAVMTDSRIVNIDGITSSQRVCTVGWVGREMHPHAASTGKAILAYLPDERIEEIVGQGLPRLTEHTITDPARFAAELQEVRQVGYAVAEEELELGLSAVAAPIWNHAGQVAASLGVSGPSFRLPRSCLLELGELTRQTANVISQKMGYAG